MSADRTVSVLREILTQNTDLGQQTRAKLEFLRRRMETAEGFEKTLRQVSIAEELMSKLIANEFERRMTALERKVRELETHK